MPGFFGKRSIPATCRFAGASVASVTTADWKRGIEVGFTHLGPAHRRRQRRLLRMPPLVPRL